MNQFELLAQYRCPRFGELPSIPLYKDQVLEELNRVLQPLRCGEITATMVNNYVKVKAVPAPEKKRYGPRQLAGLYLICLLKQVYSIGEISAVLGGLYTTEDFPKQYDLFCDALEEAFRAVFAGETLPNRELTFYRAAAGALAYKLYAVHLARQERRGAGKAEESRKDSKTGA